MVGPNTENRVDGGGFRLSPDEFATWLNFHGRRFPELPGWLKKNQAQDAWRQALSGFDLDELEAATEALFTGQIEAMGYSRHVAAMCGYIRQKRLAEWKTPEPELPEGHVPLNAARAKGLNQTIEDIGGGQILREINRRVAQAVPDETDYAGRKAAVAEIKKDVFAEHGW